MNDYGWKLTVHRKGYDPNQPRVPAGSSEGGQWVSGDIGVWGGVQPGPRKEIIAEDAADFVLNHRVGDRPSDVIERFFQEEADAWKYESLHHWARATLAELRPKRLYEMGQNFLKDKDLERLQSLPDDVWERKRVVNQVVPSQMPEIDRVRLEREYGISRHEAIPDMKPTGTWRIRSGIFEILVSRASPDKRKTFWHELSHTMTDHQIEQAIGPQKPGETAAQFSDRFAEIMSR